MTLAPSWRRDAATSYLETLQLQGVNLELRDGSLLLPCGETDAEIALVRLLKPELIALITNSPSCGTPMDTGPLAAVHVAR